MRVLRLSNSQLRGLIRRSLVVEASMSPDSSELPAAEPLTPAPTPSSLVNKFTPWSDLFPALSSDEIESDYNKESKGIGKGEILLAKYFQVEPRANAYLPFDLLISGEKWEVKEPTGSRIKFGIIGDSLCISFLQELREICMQIDKYLGADKRDADNNFNEFPKIKSDIERGELAAGTLKNLRLIVSAVFNESKTSNLPISSFDYKIQFSNGMTRFNKLKPTILQARLLSNALNDDKFVDKTAELLHDVFNDIKGPEVWFDDQLSKIRASKVCKDLAGIFLVYKDGVRAIPTAQLDTVIQFNSITQHRLRFMIIR